MAYGRTSLVADADRRPFIAKEEAHGHRGRVGSAPSADHLRLPEHGDRRGSSGPNRTGRPRPSAQLVGQAGRGVGRLLRRGVHRLAVSLWRSWPPRGYARTWPSQPTPPPPAVANDGPR